MTKLIKHPIWFILFLILLLSNLYVLFWAKQLFSNQSEIKSNASFAVHSNDRMILSESTIKKFIVIDDKNTKIKFKNHFIWITSRSKFMTFDVHTKIKTKPTVIAPGVIALDIKSVDIGSLPLSKKQALSIVNQYGDLPNTVRLDEENKRFIYTLGIQKVGHTKVLLINIDKKHRWHFDLKLKE